MRFHLLGLILLAGVATPAVAQRSDSVERRVDRLEAELRAVQRRVFPNGRAQFVEPELQPGAPSRPIAPPSGDALANLTARVDSLESQLRTLTGQVEEQGFRTRQLEDQVARLREDLRDRLERLERAAEPLAPAEPAPAETQPAPEPDEPEAVEAPGPGEPDEAPAPGASAEAAYNAGYRLWSAGRHEEAQAALNAAATQYPNSRWSSWARNLEGRAYLDDDKPATAARIFLDNYQDNPRGERAADSLYFLGQALTRLNRSTEACRVYDELEQAYPNMRDFIRQRLPQARTDARCGSTASR